MRHVISEVISVSVRIFCCCTYRCRWESVQVKEMSQWTPPVHDVTHVFIKDVVAQNKKRAHTFWGCTAGDIWDKPEGCQISTQNYLTRSVSSGALRKHKLLQARKSNPMTAPIRPFSYWIHDSLVAYDGERKISRLFSEHVTKIIIVKFPKQIRYTLKARKETIELFHPWISFKPLRE